MPDATTAAETSRDLTIVFILTSDCIGRRAFASFRDAAGGVGVRGFCIGAMIGDQGLCSHSPTVVFMYADRRIKAARHGKA
jgi:hypothetical protein